ncbi:MULTISPECIES: trehalase-like domain-containing protein [unclassified Streptomyces]|uniref:trehalase-like domain-containing protein n=1 Tax=unclassified Streptomyces TaxID=2593676 RepID=UPI0027E5A756|nr:MULTISPECIES: trehalase-like domain-containing protein [unclassified Streptomyces]
MTAPPPASGRTPTDPYTAQPVRTDGYAQLRDYAVIGDGRSAALVARDGSVDWLAWPDLDSPTLFAAVLDQARGGRFLLQPDVPYTAARRYLPGTNVLETTFTTAHGTVRLTDALALPDNLSLAPGRELVRRIEGLAGSVPMRWSVQPRFEYGTRAPSMTRRAGIPVAVSGPDAVAICAWNAGKAAVH